jgi:hypothetical protein
MRIPCLQCHGSQQVYLRYADELLLPVSPKTVDYSRRKNAWRPRLPLDCLTLIARE